MAPHLGILAGIRSEADSLIRFLPRELQATIQLSAARAERARSRAAQLIEAGATHLMSFGLAGGIDPVLRAGTLILPRTVLAGDGRVFFVDGEWHERLTDLFRDLNPFAGAVLGVDKPVPDAEDKAAMFRRWRDAAAIDMESHVLAEAAQSHGLPFVVVRVICDPSSESLPPLALACIKENGSLSRLSVLGSLVRHPAQLRALNRLMRSVKAAEKTLLGCSRRGGPVGFGMS